MQTNIYTLPEISFVGGSTQSFYLHSVQEDGTPCGLDGASIDFAICSYSDKNGEPLYSNTPTLLGDETGVNALVLVTIPEDATIDFAGKYIYQLTVVKDGQVGIPNQGLMYITANIHRSFISN